MREDFFLTEYLKATEPKIRKLPDDLRNRMNNWYKQYIDLGVAFSTLENDIESWKERYES